MANQISKVYGIKDYLNENNLDENFDSNIKNKLIEKINKNINDNYKVHSAITHYKDKYGFIPPFVLTKVLSLGVVSRYFGLLKQSDRQAIAKKFKISDKLLKQILKNLTMVRNISAHNDRLYCFRNKNYLSFKEIDKEYSRKNNETNLYMVAQTMKLFLEDDYNNLLKWLLDEIKRLEKNLSSISIEDILKIMGFPTNIIN